MKKTQSEFLALAIILVATWETLAFAKSKPAPFIAPPPSTVNGVKGGAVRRFKDKDTAKTKRDIETLKSLLEETYVGPDIKTKRLKLLPGSIDHIRKQIERVEGKEGKFVRGIFNRAVDLTRSRAFVLEESQQNTYSTIGMPNVEVHLYKDEKNRLLGGAIRVRQEGCEWSPVGGQNPEPRHFNDAQEATNAGANFNSINWQWHGLFDKKGNPVDLDQWTFETWGLTYAGD